MPNITLSVLKYDFIKFTNLEIEFKNNLIALLGYVTYVNFFFNTEHTEKKIELHREKKKMTLLILFFSYSV